MKEEDICVVAIKDIGNLQIACGATGSKRAIVHSDKLIPLNCYVLSPIRPIQNEGCSSQPAAGCASTKGNLQLPNLYAGNNQQHGRCHVWL